MPNAVTTNTDLLALTVDHSPLAHYWLNENGEVIQANRAFQVMLGISSKDVIGLKITDINPEFSLKRFKEFFQEVITNETLRLETTHLTRDNEEISVEVQAKYFRQQDASLICNFITNLSQQKELEKQLMANQERWRVGLEILNEGVWDWNLKDKKIFFSHQFAENLGFSRNEITDYLDRWKDFIHPDDAPKYSLRLADHLKGLTKKYESEHRLKTKSGKFRWFKDRGMVITRDEDGRATRMIGSSLDITERLLLENKSKEETERALAQSKSKFDNILNFSNDAIVLLESATQTIAEANPKASELLGIDKESLEGSLLSGYLPQQEKAINQFLNSVLDSKKGLSDQFVFRTKGGESLAAEVSATHFAMDDKHGILVAIQPISTEKHIEGVLSQIVEGALSKSKMDFIPSFIEQTAKVLNILCVGISQLPDNNDEELQIVSLWNKDHFEENYRYKIQGSPGKKVLAEGVTFYKSKVKEVYPNDDFLQNIGAEGYLGVPIFDSSKKPIGHFFIIDNKELDRQPWVESLLQIGASRMGLEIERKRVEDELKERLELEGLVSDISSEFINTNSKNIDETIEWALKKIGEYVNADRAYIFNLSEDQNSGSTTHEWVRRDVQALKANFQSISRDTYPWAFDLLLAKRMLFIPDIDKVEEDIGEFRKVFEEYGIKSMLNVPMVVANHVYGYLGFDTGRKNYWSLNDIVLLKLVAEVIVNSVERVKFESSLKEMNDSLEQQVKERTKALENALEEVNDLRDKLEAENIYLKEEIEGGENFGNIISQDKEFRKVLKEMEHVAKTSSTVLIQGETGTGKEVISKAIHGLSDRSNSPLIKINCAALPATLIESELFGHEKGAFTGAAVAKQGRFELANGGTLFLDEVGEMPIELQPKLLRALQEGEFERLGGTKTLKVDVRLIAATNRNLEEAVNDGTFRSDLYYRLNVFPLHVPPLRKRKSDIKPLVNHFVQKYNLKLGKSISKVPQSVVSQLEQYGWPGNVRELENIIERAVIVSPGNTLKLGEWFATGKQRVIDDDKFDSLEVYEKKYLLKVLEHTQGKISGPGGAAEILQMKPTTLESRMKKLNIKKR